MIWSNPAIEGLARRLATRTGLTFEPNRCADAEQKIRRAMDRAGVTDPVAYAALIQVDESALDDLIAELTVGETYFFREPAQFAFIRTAVLPEIRRRRGEGFFLRAWSAACASGEEAYSLAIVLAEEGLGWRCLVLATDISQEGLAKARRASYGPWSLRGEAAEAALPYLRPHGDRFEVVETIRRRVLFEYLNLAREDYPSAATRTQEMDLILCRNVLIYFDHETVRAVARRLFAALVDGGWLLTASTDPPLAELAPFQTVVTEHGVFYRRPESRPAAAPPRRPERTEWAPSGDPRRPEPGSGPRRFTAPPEPDLGPRAADPGPPRRVLTASERAAALAAARDDLAHGRYAGAAERTRDLLDEAAASVLHVRALANLDDLAGAERACGRATGRHPLCSELHYLRALLLVGLRRDSEAAIEARRVTYLDSSLAIAHFTLGSILRRQGDVTGAWRAFRNAHDLCIARPAEEIVPLSDGERAGRLAEEARAQMAQLAGGAEVRP